MDRIFKPVHLVSASVVHVHTSQEFKVEFTKIEMN